VIFDHHFDHQGGGHYTQNADVGGIANIENLKPRTTLDISGHYLSELSRR
jgi:hypothetical protein